MLESLLCKINGYFPKRNRTTLKNILLLSLCLIHKETICLNRLKGVLSLYTGKESKPSSNYKRLIRIFDNHSLTNLWIELLNFVFELLRLKSEYLIIDGTSWKRGERWFHYMTLCIVYKGVAIPIYWEDLAKHGLSNFEERKKLMNRAIKYFDLKGKSLLGDREYIGKEWFKYLIDNEINFVIRLKKNIYIQEIDACLGRSHQQMTNKVLRSKLANKSVGKMVTIDGMTLYFVAVKNPKNDPKDPVIYLLSSLIEKPAKLIASIYCLRTKIEHCFKHLKSNGFKLEQMNLRTKTRCRLLMAITVFTYVLSVQEGLKDYHQVPEKNYDTDQKQKQVSIFRFGLDKMNRYARNMEKFCNYILSQIQLANSKYKSQFRFNV